MRQLREVAAELDQAIRQVRGVEAGVRSTIGSSATGADRRVISSLGRATSAARGAQQALSAAASGLGGPR
ncbi:MAG TPA: hypothetical protein VF245_09555 [Solirubrobacterales bacterium]